MLKGCDLIILRVFLVSNLCYVQSSRKLLIQLLVHNDYFVLYISRLIKYQIIYHECFSW